VEDRHLVRAVLEELTTFAGRDAGDDLRAVVKRELGVTSAEVASDALDDNLRGGSDEDGHGRFFLTQRRQDAEEGKMHFGSSRLRVFALREGFQATSLTIFCAASAIVSPETS